MTDTNRRWVLANHPEGMPEPSDWRLEAVAVDPPAPGEMLVQSLWLSVDPYMRGRMAKGANYAAGVSLGEVMQGGGVGRVLASSAPGFAPGDIVESMGFGWQTHTHLTPAGTRKVDPGMAPIQTALGVLGLPGLTAYFTMLETARVTAGDTVVISAASGAVGQIAGQIAKKAGARRVVGLAGSDEKCTWCRDELGYDVAINHRSADLSAAIKEACPDGVDVFLDNTAGPVHDAVMQNLALGARIVICGTISLAGKMGQPDIGPRFLRQILVARATVQGFLLFDHANRYEIGRKRLADWLREGNLVTREDIVEGIDRMPEAFLNLLHGRNFGKMLVKLG